MVGSSVVTEDFFSKEIIFVHFKWEGNVLQNFESHS